MCANAITVRRVFGNTCYLSVSLSATHLFGKVISDLIFTVFPSSLMFCFFSFYLHLICSFSSVSSKFITNSLFKIDYLHRICSVFSSSFVIFLYSFHCIIFCLGTHGNICYCCVDKYFFAMKSSVLVKVSIILIFHSLCGDVYFPLQFISSVLLVPTRIVCESVNNAQWLWTVATYH